MRCPALVRAAAIALVALIVAPAAALASTAAWVLNDAPMAAGPGPQYKPVGKSAKGALVAVDRCSQGWCKIDFEGREGWVEIFNLSFGMSAMGPWAGAHFDRKSGNGTACLYTGPDFSGDYLCRSSGFVVTDFARTGLDDRFVSVAIEGDASILVCRDLNFTSFCEIIARDTPRLNRFLAGEVSSIRVY
ncbi:MAG: hypothetical protein KKH72_07200 [Alphaproteobacteria bacterium]|nr:hypothetical protein [Alphaproteobacteria bacterium]